MLFDEGAKDASGPFDDVGHSDDARELMTKYYIGDIDSKVIVCHWISIVIYINTHTHTLSSQLPLSHPKVGQQYQEPKVNRESKWIMMIMAGQTW